VFADNYAGGVQPGSPAVVTATGLGDKIPGIPADAGIVTFGRGRSLAGRVILGVDQAGYERPAGRGRASSFQVYTRSPLPANSAGR